MTDSITTFLSSEFPVKEYYISVFIVFCICMIIGIIIMIFSNNNFKDMLLISFMTVSLSLLIAYMWPIILIIFFTTSLIYLCKKIIRRFKHEN